MRFFWISSWSSDRHTGGVGAYSRGILRLIDQAFPGAQTIRIEPDDVPSSASRSRRQAAAVVRSIASRRSAKWHFDREPGLEEKVREAMRSGPPQVVIVHGLEAAALLPRVADGAARILVAPGVDSLVYRDQLDRSSMAVRVLLRDLMRESHKHRRFEEEVLLHVDGCIAISDETREELFASAARSFPGLVVPPLFSGDTRRRPPPRAGTRLGFLGKFSWWPNREAIEWFLKDVWPAAAREDLSLHVFGEGSEAYGRRAPGVFGHGYIPDAASAWDGIDVFVNPMRSSTGVNVKVCEAIHHGVPVVSSSVGARGLGIGTDPAIVIASTAAEWIAALRGGALDLLKARVPLESSRRAFDTAQHVDAFREFIEARLA
jgi:polysaccharide biosynthesis protein PslH